MSDPRLQEVQERLQEVQDLIYEISSTMVDSAGNKYAIPGHPRWIGQSGNPYMPLNPDGTMQKGYVG